MNIDKKGLTEKEYLDNYNVLDFERPSTSVDNLIFAIAENENNNIRKLSEKKLQVLLVKRDEHPFINYWSLPGSFVKLNETLEQTSIRCLETKAKIKDVYLEQLYTFDDINRDPRTRVLSVSYMGLVDKKQVAIKNEDTNCWFTLKTSYIDTKNLYELTFDNENGTIIKAELQIKNGNIIILKNDCLAFDHLKIIFYGLNRLRNKLEYTDIAFSMLGEQFTMAELQQVYEVILDKKLIKANFQRKIKDKVETLNIYRTGGFRPALLYKYKNKEEN